MIENNWENEQKVRANRLAELLAADGLLKDDPFSEEGKLTELGEVFRADINSHFRDNFTKDLDAGQKEEVLNWAKQKKQELLEKIAEKKKLVEEIKRLLETRLQLIYTKHQKEIDDFLDGHKIIRAGSEPSISRKTSEFITGAIQSNDVDIIQAFIEEASYLLQGGSANFGSTDRFIQTNYKETRDLLEKLEPKVEKFFQLE